MDIFFYNSIHSSIDLNPYTQSFSISTYLILLSIFLLANSLDQPPNSVHAKIN